MTIENGKTYITRDGHKVRIICTDRIRENNDFTILGLYKEKTINQESLISFRRNGSFDSDKSEHDYDLIREYSFWDDVEVDTKILTRHDKDGPLVKRHFAKYENGKVYSFVLGATSYSSLSSNDITHSCYAELYKED